MDDFHKYLVEKSIKRLEKRGKLEAAEYMRLNQDKIRYTLTFNHLPLFLWWKAKKIFAEPDDSNGAK